MNIVFDLGGVVFRWQPDAIIASVFSDANTRALVKKEVFEHPDWVELDRGSISLESAIQRGSARTGLPAEDVAALLNAVPVHLAPMEPTIELIRRLGETGNDLFVLSNMHVASIAYLETQHEIWSLFHGIVVSSRINMVKPEIRIYEYLLDEFGLQPNETIFIDDMPENLEAASTLGIRTIRFSDAIQCERELAGHLAI